MNFQSDFEQMSLAELEAHIQSLRSEKDRLQAERQKRENDLRQAQNLLQQTRGAVQSLIEQITDALLPDLSAQTLTQLAGTFPNEASLSAAQPNNSPEQLSFWQQIVSFWRGLVGVSRIAPPLEQRRILLRDVLWRLSAMPVQSGNSASLFRALLQKKQEFAMQERAVNASETEANQLEENLNTVLVQLSACEKAIARRKNVPSGNDESYYQNQSPFDSSYSSPIIFSNSTTFDSTAETSASDDFSFGGGGDAGGGGAGGSWDNYS